MDVASYLLGCFWLYDMDDISYGKSNIYTFKFKDVNNRLKTCRTKH